MNDDQDTDQQLWACAPDGTMRQVPCTYEGIRDGIDGATMDFVATSRIGFYVDDEGMLNEAALNIPASMLVGRALYGPVVICDANPDDEGNTLPAPADAVAALSRLALRWASVIHTAQWLGQDVMVYANEDMIPPPQIIAMPEGWAPGDPWPES